MVARRLHQLLFFLYFSFFCPLFYFSEWTTGARSAWKFIVVRTWNDLCLQELMLYSFFYGLYRSKGLWIIYTLNPITDFFFLRNCCNLNLSHFCFLCFVFVRILTTAVAFHARLLGFFCVLWSVNCSVSVLVQIWFTEVHMKLVKKSVLRDWFIYLLYK